MTIADLSAWQEAAISTTHNRDAFDCGDALLNEFLRRHARQSHDKGGPKIFVATPSDDTSRIFGFYSLSPASISYARTPANTTKGLAKHEVPVFRLGRLAVDLTIQGQGFGGQLLLAAGRRCIHVAAEVGGVAILIDAKNEPVARWYVSYGAHPLLDAPLSLVLFLSTIASALNGVGQHASIQN
jgi:GNAT superfamily N-acetyltransferase